MNIAELKRLHAEATPAPWEAECGYLRLPGFKLLGDALDRHNAHLIVALRNAAPEFCAAVEELAKLRAALGEATALLREIGLCGIGHPASCAAFHNVMHKCSCSQRELAVRLGAFTAKQPAAKAT